MSRKKSLALFALAFAVTLVATAPASLLGAEVNRLTHGALQFANPQGTLWHGTAVPVFHPPHGDPVLLAQIGWKVTPLTLVSGKFGLQITQGQQAQAMEIRVGMSSIELDHVAFAIPAAVLEEIHPMLQALHPGGQLQIISDHLTLTTSSIQGTAVAQWLSASSAFSMVNPFGSYQIKLDGSGNRIAINLSSLSGPLLLDGQGEWSATSGFGIEAHAKASAESQEALAELLHHMGPEISPGTRLIKIGRAI